MDTHKKLIKAKLLKEQKFDAIRIPVGGYEQEEETELAFINPTILKIEKVVSQYSGDVTEEYRKKYPEVFA